MGFALLCLTDILVKSPWGFQAGFVFISFVINIFHVVAKNRRAVQPAGPSQPGPLLPLEHATLMQLFKK